MPKVGSASDLAASAGMVGVEVGPDAIVPSSSGAAKKERQPQRLTEETLKDFAGQFKEESSYVKKELVNELRKEYTRLGSPLSNDGFLEPEFATTICKKWMMANAEKDKNGKIAIPKRVQHPGKQWIEDEAERMKKELAEKMARPLPPQTKVVDQTKSKEEPPKQAQPAGPVSHQASSQQSSACDGDHEFRVIFREGSYRLVKLNFLGKRVADVPLPPNQAWKLIQQDGKAYIGRGSGDIYECNDYVNVLMKPQQSTSSGLLCIQCMSMNGVRGIEVSSAF
eukprot:Skav210217  [mRNA]  locus=scaffold2492:78079:80030:+ [translate_table: standard]